MQVIQSHTLIKNASETPCLFCYQIVRKELCIYTWLKVEVTHQK